MACDEYSRLQQEVQEALETLTRLTGEQLSAFKSQDYPSFMRLDKELELTVGSKERLIGALRQHTKEHGCQSF
jgi:hypothetical protein